MYVFPSHALGFDWGYILSRPTPAFSGAAGDLHRPARMTVRHDAPRSRPGQGPRQRRPLQSNVGRRGGKQSGTHSELRAVWYTTNVAERIPKYWYYDIRRHASSISLPPKAGAAPVASGCTSVVELLVLNERAFCTIRMRATGGEIM